MAGTCVTNAYLIKFNNAIKNKDKDGVISALRDIYEKFGEQGLNDTLSGLSIFARKIGEASFGKGFFTTDVEVLKNQVRGIKNTPQPIVTQGKTDLIETPKNDTPATEGRNRRTWIDTAWGANNALVKSTFIAQVASDIGEQVIDTWINSSVDANSDVILNQAIRQYFVDALQDLSDYFKSIGREDLVKVIGKYNTIFDKANPDKAIKDIFYKLEGYFKTLSMSQKKLLGKPGGEAANAFAKFLMIHPRNFDNFLRQNFNNIVINNSMGELVNSNQKYSMVLGHNKGIRDWRQEDAVYSINKMVDGIVLNRISKWPIYHRDTKGNLVASTTVKARAEKLITTWAKALQGISNSNIAFPKYSPRDLQGLRSTFLEYFGYRTDPNTGEEQAVIDDIIEQIVDNGWTVQDILAEAWKDYNTYMPILFYLLVEGKIIDRNFKFNRNKDNFSLLNDEREHLYTIWECMYNPKNEDAECLRDYRKKQANIYQMINQVFITHERKQYTGVNPDQGEYRKVNYANSKSDRRLNELQSFINGRFVPTKRNLEFRGATITETLSSKNKEVKIVYKVPAKNTYYTITIGFDSGTKSTKTDLQVTCTMTEGNKAPVTLLSPTAGLVGGLDVNWRAHILDLFGLFQQVFGAQNLTLDVLESYAKLDRDMKSGGYNGVFKRLTQMTAELIYGQQVSYKLQGILDSRDFLTQAAQYYPNKTLKLVSNVTYNALEIFGSRIFAFMTQFSQARDSATGHSNDAVVRAGAGEQINTTILSALTTKITQVSRELSHAKDNIIQKLPLKAIKGISFVRDFVSFKRDTKAATSMNVSEFLFQNFVWGFYNSLQSVSTPLGVLSDKPNVAEVEQYLNTQFTFLDSKTNTVKTATLGSMTYEQLCDLYFETIGEFYKGMQTEVKRNLLILNKYLKLVSAENPEIPVIQLNYDNDYADTRGIKRGVIEDAIHKAIYLAQQRGENIEINEFLFFNWYNNELHVNPVLQEEVRRSYDRTATKEFLDRMAEEFVAAALQERGISLIDKSTGKRIKSSAIQRLVNSNKGWITSSNKLVLAHIEISNHTELDEDSNPTKTTRSLTDAKSLKDWVQYQRLHQYLKHIGANPKLIASCNIDSPEFTFKALLEALKTYGAEANKLAITESYRDAVAIALRKKYKETPNLLVTERDKRILIENYRASATDSVNAGHLYKNERSLADTPAVIIEQRVRNYIQDATDDKWRRRLISYRVQQQTEGKSLEDLETLVKEQKLSDDKYKDIFKFASTVVPNYTYEFKINPQISKYNMQTFLFSETALNMSVGSYVNHQSAYINPTDTSRLGSMISFLVGQQAKRNVSETSSKNQYTRGDINGVSTRIKIAVCKDLRALVATVNGIEDKKGTKPMDGSTISNYTFRAEERYSLGSQKSGVDNAKPIANDVNPKTGTGTIIKTATFTLTNPRIRKSEAYITLHKHMNDIAWRTDYGFDGNFLKDFTGADIQYKPVIVYKPSTKSYYLRDNFAIDSETGVTTFRETQITKELLDHFSDIGDKIKSGRSLTNDEVTRITAYTLNGKKLTSESRATSRPISTNYELWDLFGGAYSAHIDSGNNIVYENDNTSLDNVTIAAHNVGRRKIQNAKKDSEATVFLPLKEAKIDWVVTEGAIKQGASNINDTKMLTDISYPVTTQTISTLDIGMQLNPDHTADESKVTLMTQVVNALGLRGYSSIDAQECYEALFNLTKANLNDILVGIMDMREGRGSEEFKNALATLLLKALGGTTETDGDLLTALIKGLDLNKRDGQDYKIIRDNLPISDPQVLNKIVSNFNSLLTKSGIRMKFQGTMDVLSPSDGIFRLYGGRLLHIPNTQRYGDKGDLIDNTEAEYRESILTSMQDEANSKPLKLHQITIGASYFVKGLPETIGYDENDKVVSDIVEKLMNGESIKIDDLSTYYALRNILWGSEGYTLIEDIKAGRELAPYNCTFRTIGDTPEHFMLWDLDSIRNLHKVYLWESNHTGDLEEFYDRLTNPESTKPISVQEFANTYHIRIGAIDFSDFKKFVNTFKRELKRVQQLELNAIGSGNTCDVHINGELKHIDKSGRKVMPYELIASKTYETTFGLREGDEVNAIVEDDKFFLRRFLEVYGKDSASLENYDIVLKTISGSNYYLLHKGTNTVRDKSLIKMEDSELKDRIDWVGRRAYLMDDNGRHLYEVPYHRTKDRKIQFDFEILRDSVGNQYIYTSNIAFFIKSLSFQTIDFGRHILQSTTDIKEIISQLESIQKSKNQDAVNAALDTDNTTAIVKTALGSLSSQDTSKVPAEVLRSNIDNWISTKSAAIEQLKTDIKNGADINADNYQNSVVKQMVLAGHYIHTSFIKSLDYIVSRTPAQSHQSFMPMRIVAFDESKDNTAYVSRYQLYLQGSDFDIDKASLLGYIIKNGQFVVWSPFMRLDTIEILNASETLPFPNGSTLTRIPISELKVRAYDVIDKEIDLSWGDIETEVNGEKKQGEQITFKFPDSNIEVIMWGVDNEYTVNISKEEFQSLSDKSRYLLERAIVDKMSVGSKINTFLDLSHLGINAEGIKTNDYDYEYDFIQFLAAYGNPAVDNPSEAEQIRILGTLIRAFNRFKLAPTFDDSIYGEQVKPIAEYIYQAVDTHNTWFNERDSRDQQNALVNFVSSKIFQISSDPVNLIQAMTSVDQQTEVVKGMASTSMLAQQANHFEKGNTMAIFRLLRLTLSGKQSTGIEASSLKVYEAYNQYVSNILNFGSQEEQESLLIPNLRVAGKSIPLIANAYCKNIANIKTREIYDALQEVDNYEDAALWLSALLSLSTDNAKNPTLSKINADPEMISLYNSGIVLGIPMPDLGAIMLSHTAMQVASLQAGNAYQGQRIAYNVGSALDYIDRGPNLGYLAGQPNLRQIIAAAMKSVGLEVDEIKEKNKKEAYITVNPYNIKSSLIGSIYDKESLERAKRVINLIKSIVYKKETISDSDFIGMTKTITNRLNAYKTQLERKQHVYDKINSQATKTKKETRDLTRLGFDIEVLQTQIDQLQDILDTYKNSGSLPSNRGGVTKTNPKGNEVTVNEYLDFINIQELRTRLSSEDIARNFNKAAKAKNISFATSNENYRVMSRFISDMENYLDVIEQVQLDQPFVNEEGESYRSFKTLKQLSQMSDEMSLIRGLLSLNQQLPNSKENSLAFINKFQSILENRIEGSDNAKAIRDTREVKDFGELNKSKGIEGLRVSLEEFVFDPEYRKAAIAAYGQAKFAVNILGVIESVQNYFGYLTTAAVAQFGLKDMSYVYRETQAIMEAGIIEDMGVTSLNDVASALKSTARYIANYYNNQFLRSHFQKPINVVAVDEDQQVDPNKVVPIVLGTNAGNLAFINYVNEVLIPRLKKNFSINSFIKSLHTEDFNDTQNHNTVIEYTVRASNISQDEVDRRYFDEMVESFNELSKMPRDPVTGLPITSIFFLYDLLVYGRQPSQKALTPIFNTLFSSDTNEVINAFKKFTSNADQSGQNLINLSDPTIVADIQHFIAPVINIYGLRDSKFKYVWVGDPAQANRRFLLAKNEKEKTKSPDYDEDFAYGDVLELDFIGADMMDGEEEDGSERIKLSSIAREADYTIISTVINQNPYINSKDVNLQVMTDTGVAVINPDSVIIGDSHITIDNTGKILDSNDFIDKVNELRKGKSAITLDAFEDTKVFNAETSTYEFDVAAVQNLIENNC